MADELRTGVSLEDAYAVSMVGRVALETSKQKPMKLSRQKFRKAALEYYSANNLERREVRCSLLGWSDATAVTAAHIVPRSLDKKSLGYIFGAEVEPTTDVRNSLFLHRSLKRRLDSGQIAIVPLVGNEGEWKCVVTQKDKLKDIIGKGKRLKLKRPRIVYECISALVDKSLGYRRTTVKILQ
ncbi:predicted protein [Uncinocarpus reesii 1704]|uniref:HNH nuclease domain-containing protein n=1 Tax=Uncinocarpus reesii (strain UAMH 1704) TaxID=336963 RepID=C4JDN9_UNCRE|nr:uncharacterized protein UREG_00671 [Uncinocarpus reesii 1704]EEP75824.1 predicted protein [Uncinocarpus reesii 1704]